MSWIFSGKQDVYLEIAEKYEQYINAGLYRAGDHLPSVRHAACEIGVNPNTVARAYALLEERGIVYSLPKKGVFVAERGGASVDCREMLAELRKRGITYEELIAQAETIAKKVCGSEGTLGTANNDINIHWKRCNGRLCCWKSPMGVVIQHRQKHCN